MARVRALITAFGPFQGREQNQSQLVLEHCLRRLSDPWRAQLLPVHLPQLRAQIAANARIADLRIWLALGECSTVGPALLETRARNHYDFGADVLSAGGEAGSGALEAAGPEQVETSSVSSALFDFLVQRGHALQLSQDAGQHACNALIYLAQRAQAAGGSSSLGLVFVHLPRRAEDLGAQVQLVLDAMSWLGGQAIHAA
jgi:pyrrolidone-carboxylate peptidase